MAVSETTMGRRRAYGLATLQLLATGWVVLAGCRAGLREPAANEDRSLVDASVGTHAHDAGPVASASPQPGTGVDVAEDAGNAGGQTPADAGVTAAPPPADAGAAIAPGRTTGRCDREGVLRRGQPWCDNPYQVWGDYGCAEVVQGLGASDKTWVGTLASLDRLNFVVELWDRVSGTRSSWACQGDPPEDWYFQVCETPFAGDCKLAEDFPDRFARGEDYRPICAAAAAMRLTRRITLNDRGVACAPPEQPAL